jgi:acyl-coenzyme A synthetase/AMP-(fatty) acid ligase
VKSAVFGQRRSARTSHEPAGSLAAALAPAFAEGRWRVPDRFNFTRDVVEVLGSDPKRRALTFLAQDGIIEPRTFLQLAHGAARWASWLREQGVGPGDRLLVLVPPGPDWLEVMLAGIKVGAVTVPAPESLPAAAVGIRVAALEPKLLVASAAVDLEHAVATGGPRVVSVDEVRSEAHRLPEEAPTHEASPRDPTVVVSTSGRTNGPRDVVQTHRSTFAARHQAEHWLDAGPGDVVWCTAHAGSTQILWTSILGSWSRGAEIVLGEAPLEPAVELELVCRLGVTTLCRTPGEYAVLAESDRLARARSGRLRRLVSTGTRLPELLSEIVEEQSGLTIHDGYGQAETGIIVGQGVAGGAPRGSIGRALPGYDVGVIDDSGNAVPPGEPGDLALRGEPPSLFAGYWNAPADTKSAFRGDWYVTGDVATCDEDGFFWLVGRAADVPVRRAAYSASGFSQVPSAQDTAPEIAPPEPSAAETAPPAPVRAPRTPLWARVTATIWLLLVGILIGGAAIPHAQEEPRVVPRSEDVPHAICVPPAPQK